MPEQISAVSSDSLNQTCDKLGIIINRMSESEQFSKKINLIKLKQTIKAGDSKAILSFLANDSEAIFAEQNSELEKNKYKLFKNTPPKGLFDSVKASGGTLLYKLMDQALHFKDD